MSKITGFDRSSCKDVGKMVEETLANLGKELGLSFIYGGGSFDPKTFKFKIEATVLDPDGSIPNKEAEAFTTFASWLGLKPDDLNKTVKIGKKMFKIIGAKPSSHKYPILLEDMNGKRWKYPSDVVKAAIDGNPDFVHVKETYDNRMETHYSD